MMMGISTIINPVCPLTIVYGTFFTHPVSKLINTLKVFTTS